VHVGDVLAFLSRDHYPACSHRVVRPPAAAATADAVALGRLSMPFLVRPRSEHVLDTREYAADDNPRLVAVEGVRCADLRRLFDARGKRMLDARRKQRRAAAEAAQAEAARRARAKAYREAVLAGRPLSPVDSSEDEDPG
jgi:hypothetical protein